MKRFNGFSLMEMMVVLLIVSVVAAASAPMINKKLLQEASEKSPWVRTRGMSIAYNLNAASDQTASIGATQVPSIGGMNPKFYIRGISGNAPLMYLKEDLDPQKPASDNAPVITIEKATKVNSENAFTLGVPVTFMRLGAYTNTHNLAIWNLRTVFNWSGRGISLTTATENSVGSGCVTIGDDAQTRAHTSVGIGSETRTNGYASVAIGDRAISHRGDVVIGARASTKNVGNQGNRVVIGSYTGSDDNNSVEITEADSMFSIAIGAATKAKAYQSIAIGHNAIAEGGVNSDSYKGYSGIAIGPNAHAENGGTLAIGSGTHAQGRGALAIGTGYPDGTAGSRETISLGFGSIAIGQAARVNDTEARRAIAIGSSALVSAENSIGIGQDVRIAKTDKNSVAIGCGAMTRTENQIVLGGATSINNYTYPTVYIPGNLVVDGNVCLAKGSGKKVFMRTKYHGTSDDSIGLVRRSSVDSGRDLYVDLNDELPDWTQKSDRRLKNVGKVFTGGLEEIKKLEVFNYTFKKDKEQTPRVGVMAQDLQKIFPNAVFKGDDGFLRIRMEDMFYALVNAVKELDKKIEEFKNQEFIAVKKRIDVLEKENKELKEQNKAFEKRLAELEKKLK